MPQLYIRIHRLEIQSGLLSRGPLNALFEQTERLARYTGVPFETAVIELVAGLTDRELTLIIAEAESRYGKEFHTAI